MTRSQRSPGFGGDELAREQRVLAGVARAALEDEALALDPGEAEQRLGGIGLGAAVAFEQRPVAAGEDEAGAGVALGDLDAGGHARGRLVEGDLAAAEADGAAEHDDAVDLAPVGGCLRETILERPHDQLADGAEADREQPERRQHCCGAAEPLPAREQEEGGQDREDDQEVRRAREEPDNFRDVEEHASVASSGCREEDCESGERAGRAR